ncbi:hypothetical protein C2I17_14950 [Niallia circulans]|nr:hypothetical protein C2I17_14950 [Niallia circulans]
MLIIFETMLIEDKNLDTGNLFFHPFKNVLFGGWKSLRSYIVAEILIDHFNKMKFNSYIREIISGKVISLKHVP